MVDGSTTNQGLAAFYATIRKHGCPEAMVSDHSSAWQIRALSHILLARSGKFGGEPGARERDSDD